MKKLLLACIIGLFAVNSFAADAVKAEPAAQAATNKHAKHTIAPHKKISKKESADEGKASTK